MRQARDGKDQVRIVFGLYDRKRLHMDGTATDGIYLSNLRPDLTTTAPEIIIDPKLKADHINYRLIATDQKDTRAGSTAARLYQEPFY